MNTYANATNGSITFDSVRAAVEKIQAECAKHATQHDCVVMTCEQWNRLKSNFGVIVCDIYAIDRIIGLEVFTEATEAAVDRRALELKIIHKRNPLVVK